MSVSTAFAHAVELCIIDGVCLGIDVGSEQEKKAIVHDCRTYLNKLLVDLFGADALESQLSVTSTFVNTQSQIGVKPFLIQKNMGIESKFVF
jgi:hypothetical protein